MLSKAESQHRTPHFIIASTMPCNFKCPYCYAAHSSKKMMRDTSQKIVRFIDECISKEERKVNIIWVGGEPLMNIEEICYINSALTNEYDILVGSTVVTNGSLLDMKAAERLKKAKVKNVVVSLDGPKQVHDRRRRYLLGKGSYDDIINNIASMVECFSVTVRVNVNDDNVESVPQLISILNERDLLGKVQVSLVPIQMFDAENEYTLKHSVALSTIEKIFDMVRSQHNVLWGGPDPCFHTCPGMNYNDYCIDPEGKFYACPIGIGDTSKIIGDVNDCLPTPEYYAWYDFCNEIPSKCTDCAYLPLCMSNCCWISKEHGEKSNQNMNCERKKKYFDICIKNYIQSLYER